MDEEEEEEEKHDKKNSKTQEKDEDEDEEKRRKNEMIRKAEKAIFNQHIGIVKSKDSNLLLGVGRSSQNKSMWIPLSMCVECTLSVDSLIVEERDSQIMSLAHLYPSCPNTRRQLPYALSSEK